MIGIKQPFAQRIVIAFVLMTVLVSGVFSLSIVAIVFFIEQRLVSEEMHRELHGVLRDDIKNGRAPRLDAKTRFYASNMPEYAIPAHYAQLDDGFTEWADGTQAFYAYAQEINGVRYILVQDQNEFEAHEQALFNVVLAGFILTVLGAWALGRGMARHVMAPLSHLAQQVQHYDQRLSSAPPLAAGYSHDEIGQLASAFDGTLTRLRQSLERERLFTSDVSHELRTPLMVIATSCELLEQASLGPRQQEQLQRIACASNDMQALVQTFLHLARGRIDEADCAATATLAHIAQQHSMHWGALAIEKGLHFECIQEHPDLGRYNPTLLGTVMANLLRNALHYTDHGHIRLRLEAGGFRVEDSGTGIASAQHESIFQPFVRGEHARGEGLGLGLSLVKRICTHQGWSITIEPVLPRGSSFRVRFD